MNFNDLLSEMFVLLMQDAEDDEIDNSPEKSINAALI
jgi:hypothetical protein